MVVPSTWAGEYLSGRRTVVGRSADRCRTTRRRTVVGQLSDGRRTVVGHGLVASGAEQKKHWIEAAPFGCLDQLLSAIV